MLFSHPSQLSKVTSSQGHNSKLRARRSTPTSLLPISFRAMWSKRASLHASAWRSRSRQDRHSASLSCRSTSCSPRVRFRRCSRCLLTISSPLLLVMSQHGRSLPRPTLLTSLDSFFITFLPNCFIIKSTVLSLLLSIFDKLKKTALSLSPESVTFSSPSLSFSF